MIFSDSGRDLLVTEVSFYGVKDGIDIVKILFD